MSTIQILFAVALGVIVAVGLKNRPSMHVLKYVGLVSLLLVLIVAIHKWLGHSPEDLLLLKLPSKSTAAISALYSFYIGALLALALNGLRKLKDRPK